MSQPDKNHGSGDVPETDFGESDFSGIAIKELLSQSKRTRQRAVACFPLNVAQMATDLKRLCDMQDAGYHITDDIQSCMDHLEGRILLHFQHVFGRRLLETTRDDE